MKLYVFALMAFFTISCQNTSTKEKDEDSNGTGNSSAETITPVKISIADIPAECKIAGTVQEAWRWNDSLGENLLLTSMVEPYYEKMKRTDVEESRAAELYAVHYINKGNGYTTVWQLNDAEKGCEFDITAGFIKGSTTVTDLDHNGIAETKLQYNLACRSDVSPAYMKLVMHEGEKKYALSGLRWVKISPEDEFIITENTVNLEKIPKEKDEFDQWMLSCGRYETESDFAEASPEFLSFARTEWLKYVKEAMGEEK